MMLGGTWLPDALVRSVSVAGPFGLSRVPAGAFGASAGRSRALREKLREGGRGRGRCSKLGPC